MPNYKNNNTSISFVTTFNSISENGITASIEKYAVQSLIPYNKQFLVSLQ